jgi:hypothetical protein
VLLCATWVQAATVVFPMKGHRRYCLARVHGDRTARRKSHPRRNTPPFNDNGDRPFLNRLGGTSWNGSLNSHGNIKP